MALERIVNEPLDPCLECYDTIVQLRDNHINQSVAGPSGDIREQSVKEHVNQICTKLGAANRAEAVAIALRKLLLKI